MNVRIFNSARIRIFDLEGSKIGTDGNIWLMGCLNPDGHTYENCHVPIFSAVSEIEAIIGYDMARNVGHKISSIGINSRIAVALFLEGHLTLPHFQKSQQGHGHVILQDIPFCGKHYAVVIRDERAIPYQIATVTPQGEVV